METAIRIHQLELVSSDRTGAAQKQAQQQPFGTDNNKTCTVLVLKVFLLQLLSCSSSTHLFVWTSEYQHGLDSVKSPVLEAPDFTKPFKLEVGAL